MSLWRRIAIEKLPELRSKIANAGNAFGVWIELRMELKRIHKESHEPENDALCARIYEYAAWCLSQPRNDYLRTAVVVCFYEDLPLDAPVWKDAARWLSPEQFTALRPAFLYHLSERELNTYAADLFASKASPSRFSKRI